MVKRTMLLPDVFVADDKFGDVVRCLEARGWRRHAHATFPKFRLKWTNYSRIAWADAAHRMQSTQYLNHLQHAVLFSQKDVFAHALYAYERTAAASDTVCVDAFFPRTFDLRHPDDVQQLREWHLYSHALAVLKRFAAQSHTDSSSSCSIEELDAACMLLHAVADAGTAFFSRTQSRSLVLDVDAPAWLPLRRPLSASAELLPLTDYAVSSHCTTDLGVHDRDSDRARAVTHLLKRLQTLDAQFDAVSGATGDSVWICKPSNLSQGRGICLLTSLDAIVALAQLPSQSTVDGNGDGSDSSRWVVQKYVERPLLTLQRGRKFDIRQWVVIASLMPLRAFWYCACYLRFCAQPFDAAALGDAIAHLSNHSVQKFALEAELSSDGVCTISTSNAESDAQRPTAASDARAFESMWHSEQLQRHLWQEHGRDVWTETIVPQMQRATRIAILSTAPELASVGRGFEWLGLDFVLDEHLRPWLLEVNVSPDVSHSTRVTADLVPRATADLLELLLDDDVSADNGWHLLDCSAIDSRTHQQQQQR